MVILEPNIHSAPFHEQMRHYRIAHFGHQAPEKSYESLARLLDRKLGDSLIDMGFDMKKLAEGLINCENETSHFVPPPKILEAIAGLLFINAKDQPGFLRSALRARSLKDIVYSCCTAHDVSETPHGFYTISGIGDRTALGWFEEGKIKQREHALKVTELAGIKGEQLKDFLYERGGFFLDTAHILEVLSHKKITGKEAIKAFCAIKGWGVNTDLAKELETHPRVMTSQLSSKRHLAIPRKSAFRMLELFDITERADQETFMFAIGHFIDTDHLISALEKKTITRHYAITGIIDLLDITAKNYAALIGAHEKKVSQWQHEDAPKVEVSDKVKRKREELPGANYLLATVNLEKLGLSEDKKKRLMQCFGYYLSPNHINEDFKDSRELGNLLFAMSDLAGINRSSIPGGVYHWQRQTPTVATLAKAFYSICNQKPELEECRQIFIDVAARFLGHYRGAKEKFVTELTGALDILERANIGTGAQITSQRP